MNLLYDINFNSKRVSLLMDVSGAVVARITFFPDGKVASSSNDYPLAGTWKRENQILIIQDNFGETRARFNAEGLDKQGRKLLWGYINVGSLWLKHCLREISLPYHFPSISFCVTCKGRLHHLRETLPRNLIDNSDYPNLEFVLLDYNSNDGLKEWIEQELWDYIENGRLSYFWTRQPEFFNISHAKNMSLRLASGEILCIVDADNFTGKGYAYYIADNVGQSNVLVGCRIKDNEFQPVHDEGCVGRFALRKEAFYELGGMNEELAGWGYEDIDFYHRLIAKGYHCQTIEHQYTTCIPHTDDERGKELEFSETGRNTPNSHGTCFNNSVRSKTNIRLGKIVSNDGRFGCGSVIKNHGKNALALREQKDPMISICIVCCDKIGSLRETLPQNLDSTRFYPKIEFILLSCGENELENWLKEKFRESIESGRLIHYQMDGACLEADCNNIVHQKNISMRLASGDILCNSPPNHIFNRDFTTELARKFHHNWIYKQTEGKSLIISRHLFYLAGGMNEGIPDEHAVADLLNRLEKHLSDNDSPQRISDGEKQDFGSGIVRHNDKRVVVSPYQFPRVSFTTTCKGSFRYLKETLPRNLLDNQNYPNHEFVLFDCSGNNGLEKWVKNEMHEHLRSGRLVYYRSLKQPLFNLAHAKNFAVRLSTGEFLCNLDADNFTGRHFAFYIADKLHQYDYLSGCLHFGEQIDSFYHQRTAGRIALSRRVFNRVEGFNERITEWGRDNIDLYERLKAMGYRGEFIDGRFLECIPIGDKERELNADVDERRCVMNVNVGALAWQPY